MLKSKSKAGNDTLSDRMSWQWGLTLFCPVSRYTLSFVQRGIRVELTLFIAVRLKVLKYFQEGRRLKEKWNKKKIVINLKI